MWLLNFFAILAIIYGIAGLVISLLKIKSSEFEQFTEEARYKNQRGGNVALTDFTGNKYFTLPYWLIAGLVGILSIVLFSLIVKINPQEVGVISTPKGVNDEELLTGWHIVAPWNNVYRMDKTVWVYTCAQGKKEGSKEASDAIWAPTKDGIKMGFDVSVSWKINPKEASWIYQNVSENDGGISGKYVWLEENVVRTKLKSALALTVSNFTPIEAYSNKRQEIQDMVYNKLKKEFAVYKLTVDQVDIREVYYNREFEKAINDKKLQEQKVLTLIEITKQKEEELKQAKINKDIAIQKAEGEAKALQIKGNSISSNPQIIALEWIDKWDGQLPTYMMGDKGNVMIQMPVK